ncbi:ATP-grasp domain-containing protein [Bacillus massilinigeriensis]|uniref:ATP-grasp domain-containing protein n=1 Tax=Bacillus mediterraneensis TaxID=1805474 RepID=UPI0008F848EE|nr:ATP-grasp domain-containing protein [Bacillus mediterraneensis]
MVETAVSIHRSESNCIRPSISMEDIYGGNFIYNPKLYSHNYDHFSSDLLSLEALTGRELGVIGDMPVICHAGVATDESICLMEKAGLAPTPFLYTYRTEEEYKELLTQISQQHQKIIFQYPHPSNIASHAVSWIDPEIQAYLCDKRSIPDLVPPENTPFRKVMSIEEILQSNLEAPFVLKTGDGRPTSGGSGVLLVEDREQLAQIDETFGDLSNIIVEEFIRHEDNISVHYAADYNGNIIFLGISEQLVNKDGCFRGSWVTTDVPAEWKSIVKNGFKVMKNIVKKGYVGMAGFDVLISGSRHYFIDLNVRFNGSTASLLLHDSIVERYGKAKLRFCNLEWEGEFDKLIPLLSKYIDQEQFIPLGLLDADFFPVKSKISKAVGIVLGHSIFDVDTILKNMQRDGLCHKE